MPLETIGIPAELLEMERLKLSSNWTTFENLLGLLGKIV